jgi:signal transduction histidine kinase
MPPLLFKSAYFILICFASVLVSLFVFYRNPRSSANRFFAFTVLLVGLWTLSNAFLHLYADRPPALLWGRLTFAAASFIPASFLLFTMHFRVGRTPTPTWPLYLLVCLGIILVPLSLSPYLVTSVALHHHALRLTYGPLYHAFSVYFLLAFALSFVVLLYKYRHAGRGGRLQLFYVLFGSLIGVAGGATTNLLVPFLFQTSQFSWAGPAFSFVALAFITHAIFRHGLLDIRVALTRGASYLLSFFATALLLSLIVLIPSQVGALSATRTLLFFALLTGTCLGLVFLPMVRLFQVLFDRYAFRPAYDHHSLLEEMSSTLPSFLQAHDLYAYLHGLLDRTVRPDTIYIYLQQPTELQCVYFSAVGPPPEPPPPLDTEACHRFLDERRGAVLREELDPSAQPPAGLLAAVRWDLLLALTTATTRTGFVALGPKLSLDPYFPADIAFLSTLCRQASVVLENARLYAQATTVKEQLARILDNMESGVLAIDEAGRVFSANSAAARILETTPERLCALRHQDLPEPLPATLSSVLARATPIEQHEATLVTPSGRTLHLFLNSSRIRVASGPSSDVVGAGAIVVFADHSQLHQLALERRRADRLLDFQRMASAIAHEIKNPLVAIKTFAELLPERFADQEFRDVFSAVAVREIDRIDRLVARLRGASNEVDHPLVPLSLPALIEDVVALVRPQLERSHLKIAIDYSLDSTQILGHAAQLHQLLLNLLLNAMEAMPGGGTITIAVSMSPLRDHVTVSIADTGTGIPTAMIDSILDPFVSTKPHGSGLGLAISKAIATTHNALLHVRNNAPAPGATITLSFPVWAPPRRTADRAVNADAMPQVP